MQYFIENCNENTYKQAEADTALAYDLHVHSLLNLTENIGYTSESTKRGKCASHVAELTE